MSPDTFTRHLTTLVVFLNPPVECRWSKGSRTESKPSISPFVLKFRPFRHLFNSPEWPRILQDKVPMPFKGNIVGLPLISQSGVATDIGRALFKSLHRNDPCMLCCLTISMHCCRLLYEPYFCLTAFPNKARVAILAELDKEKKRLIQNPSTGR